MTTYILILCLACGSGGNSQTISVGPDCEIEAQRFRAIPGTVAECLRLAVAPDPRLAELQMSIRKYCHEATSWRPRPENAEFYSDIPKSMDECMARYSPHLAGS